MYQYTTYAYCGQVDANSSNPVPIALLMFIKLGLKTQIFDILA